MLELVRIFRSIQGAVENRRFLQEAFFRSSGAQRESGSSALLSARYCESTSNQQQRQLYPVQLHWQSGAVLGCGRLGLISASSQGASPEAGEPSVKRLAPIGR